MDLLESDSEPNFNGFPDEEPGTLSGFTEETDEVATILKQAPKATISRSKFIHYYITT